MARKISFTMRVTGAAAAVVGLALLGGACRTVSGRPASSMTSRLTGIASWYGPGFQGRPTSSRETYDMYDATAAHNTFPFGTRVRVTNLDNGKSAIVRINDRGPFVDGRIIDLSYSAAYLLDMLGPGTAPVRLEVLKSPPRLGRDSAFSVQAGAFTREENARETADALGREFASVDVTKHATWNRTFYRVRIPAANRAEAAEIAERLAGLGFPAFILDGE